MTRFARAKGSKADNERRPLEATAWSEVKRQLKIPGEQHQEGNQKKRRLHYNPEDEDDDFAAANDSGNNSAGEAASGDEAVEDEEPGEPEPEVRCRDICSECNISTWITMSKVVLLGIF